MTLAKNETYSTDTRISDLIDMGMVVLGLELGIVSRVVDHIYTIQYSNDVRLIGEQFPLDQTYCSVTLKLPSDNVLAIHHFSVSDYLDHPCYQQFKLETYIGASSIVNGAAYGTLNFSQADVHQNGFPDYEKMFILWLARAIVYVLSQQSSQL